MTEQEILDGAPYGATHIGDDDFYHACEKHKRDLEFLRREL